VDLSLLKQVIPYQWRVQSFYPKDAPTKAKCVAYIDARQVMDLLDEVAGPENWTTDFKRVGESLFCGIGIWHEGKWIWKWDAGSESDIEKEKGEASDSFKRAAVHWGVGRFLYNLEILDIKAGQYKGGKGYGMDDEGNLLFSNDQLSEFCTRKYNSIHAGTKQKEKGEKENKTGSKGIAFGDSLAKSHLLNDKERAAWEKKKENEKDRHDIIDRMKAKIEYGEKVENKLYTRMRIDTEESSAILKEKVKQKMIAEFAPLRLEDAMKKFPLDA
jgi:hypothetical protein